MAEQYFMGLDGFIWFVGVVENRNDPAELGRVQVRCLGYHTEDLSLIPTADLPWAHVMHPATDPAVQGLGNSPSFLVEGTWVVGFFQDAKDKQQPIVMGTLPGYPQSTPDTTKGFNDPTGTYPSQNRELTGEAISKFKSSGHSLNESDVSRLARGGDSEQHSSLIKRRALKQDSVPIATEPYNTKTDNTQVTGPKRESWNEPDPRGHSSSKSPYPTANYPYNHVHESEAGHIHEVDDTPGGERLMQQHSSGSFTEIHPDGSKVVKVVGDNYEIIAGKSNILVVGDTNITYDGNVRQLIKKDYVLEVEGDYSIKVHKNNRVKIGAGGAGNLYEEVTGSHTYNINGGVRGRVGRDIDINVGRNESRLIGGTYAIVGTRGMTLNSAFGSTVITATKDISLTTSSLGSIDIKAGTTASMAGVAVTQLGGLAINLGDATTLTHLNTALTSIISTAPAVSMIGTTVANITSPAVTIAGPTAVLGPLGSSISVKAPFGLFGAHKGIPH